MALKVNYNFKGIELPEAYFMVENTRSRKNHVKNQVLISEAVLNELDEILTKIRKFPGVNNSETSLFLSTKYI